MGDGAAIALAAGALGLGRPRIIPWELNIFQWLGPDVGRAPRPAGAWWRLGVLNRPLRVLLADRVEVALKARRARVTPRSE